MAIPAYRATGNTVNYTPVADVAAGTVLEVGGFKGVASVAIAANTQGAIFVEGIVALPTSGVILAGALATGDLVGVDTTAQEIVANGVGDFDLYAAADKAAGAVEGQVRLSN